ncbi:DUF3953 domain-containing protein [Bacillus sp. DX1.1]|uniref:DUF3953 domain-containing protein n=1 Tax=unclassified Bacillus (in: firmicutes) TaxID=185979 RepID=UPI00256FA85D|nr:MULTISPECIES: DUF3953 domain-containing protein [unclassified Bacillus (in: firmicutes)]MDM5156951.1 DUF3953 domain-containing protein [Bacillus sp. DX1.1]WJE81192.1 DUF3953 domain-containing protein [Bacillus sp. DX3.1]
MLNILRILLALITLSCAAYYFYTDDFSVFPYMQLALACMMIIVGISEIKATRKFIGIGCFFVSGLCLYVSILEFLR